MAGGLVPTVGRTRVVLVGSWNVSIFQPPWVASRLFPGEPEMEVEVSYSPTLCVVFKLPSVILEVSSPRILLGPAKGADVESLGAVEEAAQALVTALPETPLQGLGFNLGFDISADKSGQVTAAPADAENLAKNDAKVGRSAFIRDITFQGSRFNFAVTHHTATVALDFNHHHDVTTGSDVAKQLLNGFTRAHEVSLAFLKAVYGLSQEGA